MLVLTEMSTAMFNAKGVMQDKCEPPVYVSDRRFMKAINLLQVAAHADGRSQVWPPRLCPPCVIHMLCAVLV